MKQLSKILVLTAALVLAMTSCYDDYKTDFEYTSTYFSMQSPLRTVVLQEDAPATIEIGVMLGGRYVNESSETVNFKIDPTLLDSTPQFQLLPESYYTLSDESQIEIPSGEKLGTITLTFTDAFINDSMAHLVHYALPVQIISTSLDSILPKMSSTVIAVRYQNEYYGAYRTKGVDYSLDASGNKVDTAIYSETDFSQNRYCTFGTLGADTCTMPNMGLDVSGDNILKLAIAADGSLEVSEFLSKEGTIAKGDGSYDADSKTFFLSYDYEVVIQPSDITLPSYVQTHQVNDTLYHFAVPMTKDTWSIDDDGNVEIVSL